MNSHLLEVQTNSYCHTDFPHTIQGGFRYGKSTTIIVLHLL